MLNQKANSKDDRYSLSLNIPFERPKIIGYNANYWGIFINWLCTLSRMMMIIYLTLRITDLALFIVLSYPAFFDVPRGSLIFFKHISVFANFLAVLYLLFDFANLSYALKLLNDYRSRMLFSRFASKFGINVHVMRLTVLCVIVYPEDLSFHTLTTLSKAGEPDNLALIVLEYIFLLAIPFYVVALWMNKVGTMSGNRDAVANSFLADWESSYEFKGAEKRKLSVFTVFVFISNTVFVFYFLFFLADFKMAENTFHTDWRDNVSLIMPVVTLLIYMADMLYNLFRRMRNSYIYRSFFYLGLFVAYFCLEMHIDLLSNAMVSSAAPKPSAWNFSDGFYAEGWNWGGAMKVLWLYLAIFMSFNFALMLFYHSTTLISLTFFVIKWMFSLGGIAAILSIGGILLVLIGFALSAYSYMQSYFYSYLTLEKSFKAFLDMMKAIKDVVMAFLSGFSDIANALNKVTGGYFCIVLIGVTILVAILVLIGFGVGVASMLMKKLFELLQMLFKVIRSIRNLQDVFTNIYTFTKKSEAMQDSASTSSVSKMKQGSTIYYFMVLLGMLITIGGIVTVYFYAAERYLEVSRPVFVMTLFIIEILLLAYLGFIYVTEYIFSQNYDLVIMFLRILPGYGILYTKISLILVCLGVALILASYAIGYSSGWMRNSNFFDEMDVETFVWPSFERLCCPLVASPRGRQHDDNACATLCNRLCCCFDKKVDQINDGDTSAKFVKYIFCPCTEDLNPVYDDTRVANLFANFVCCCFYDGKFQRSWNPIKICFCVPNFGKVAKMKNQLDNTFDVSVVANNKIEESHLNYYEIKTRMTKDRYNKAKHFRPIIPESAEKTTGFSLDAKTMAKLKGPPLPPGLLGSFGFWQVLKEIFQNGFNKFAQYLIPILMHGITLYIMYKALTNTWVLVSFKSDSVFSSVLSDTSTESTSDHVTEVERNKKSMCPVLDLINFIKNLMIKLIFAVLKSVFPQHRELLTKLEELIILMTSLSGRDMIPRFFRLLILLPAAAYCVFHTFLSMISSFVIPFTRVHIVLILFPFFNVFSALMMLPKLIGFLFENLPFFNFEARFMSGYQNGLTVIYMLLMNMIFTLIDHILPPSPPNSEDNFRKRVYAEWYDQEMKHPISVWT